MALPTRGGTRRPIVSGPARGVAALATLYGAPIVLWLAERPAGASFTDAPATLTSLGVLLGLAGVTAFGTNLVLGARLRTVQSFLGGLENMYRFHRRNGPFAFGLLVAHALFIIAGRAAVSWDAVAALFQPSAGWEILFGVISLIAMAAAITATLFIRLGHEVFVYVQRSFGVIFIAAALHVFGGPGSPLPSLVTIYLGAVYVLAISAFAYRSLFGNLLVRRLSYRVTKVNRLDEFVTEIVMTPMERSLDFVPGQFVFVNFRSVALSEQFHPFNVEAEGHTAVFSIRAGEITNQFHPFSITSAPGDPELRITVKAVGDYTRALRDLEEGAEAIVEGPYGTFSYRNVPNTRQVWISGGIGLTPFLSMARSLGHEDPTIDLYYAVEHDNEAYFLDEFLAIAKQHHNLRVIPIIRDREGFLTADRIGATSSGVHGKDYLICGPPPMIDALRKQLVAKGVSLEKIHAEEFGFARLGHRRPAST